MTVLFVIQIIVVVMMIGVILMQKTTADGLMAGSGSPDSFLSGRSSANVLTKTTAILATIFIVNSLVMGYMASHSKREGSVLDEILGETTSQKVSPVEGNAETQGDVAEGNTSTEGGEATQPAKAPSDASPASVPVAD